MRWLWRRVLRQVCYEPCFTGIAKRRLEDRVFAMHFPSHREPKAHNCVHSTTAVATEDRNAQAKALLAKAFSASKTASPARSAPTGSGSSASVVPEPNSMPPKPKDPAKEARLRKVELMKMRHQAVPVEAQFARSGATHPPVDKRLFFKARSETSSMGSAVAYWVTKVRVASR